VQAVFALRVCVHAYVPLTGCDPCVPQRTKVAWARKGREAEATYGNGYLRLLPALGAEARPQRLVSDAHLMTLHAVLDAHDATYRHKKLRRAYGSFLAACAAGGLHELSQRTFYTEAHR
jgi:putative transposase